MKSRKNILFLIVILSFLVVVLTLFLIVLISKDYKFGFDKNKFVLVEDLEVEVTKIDSINIYTYSTDVEFRESDEKVKIEYYSNVDENSKIVMKDNGIYLREKKNNSVCFGICNVDRKVVIYIPSKYLGDLDIKTSSGDVFSRTNVNDINIVSSSGDIKLLDVNNISLKTSSGDVEIGSVNNKFSLVTSSGDVDIESLNIGENSFIKTSSGDVDIVNNYANCYVETNTSSGDVEVNKFDRKSDIVLKINTTSGDVEVN